MWTIVGWGYAVGAAVTSAILVHASGVHHSRGAALVVDVITLAGLIMIWPVAWAVVGVGVWKDKAVWDELDKEGW